MSNVLLVGNSITNCWTQEPVSTCNPILKFLIIVITLSGNFPVLIT